MKAKGIPDKSEYGDPFNLEEGNIYDFIVQKHKADRAGLHRDIRIGDKNTGLHSWATKKNIGKKPIAIFHQPLHAHSYKGFEGEIKSGYGKGYVTKEKDQKALVNYKGKHSLGLTLINGSELHRLKLVKPDKFKDKEWLLFNQVPQFAGRAVKPKFKSIKKDEVENIINHLPKDSVVQPKVDGALSFLHILKDKMEVQSHRTSKRTGKPILHTERIFKSIPKLNIPKEHQNSILLGEIFGSKNNKTIPAQDLGGLLNSNIDKSIETQKKKNINLKEFLFDIEQHNGKRTLNLPYNERYKLLKEIVKYLPKDKFSIPEQAQDAKSSNLLLSNILKGKHPLTREGVVIRTPGKNYKYKAVDEHDVYVREFTRGEGKYDNNGVGAFKFSHTPTGPIVGKCSSGLSDSLRHDMYKDPDKYIGRIARVSGMEKYRSGAIRAPTLISLHEG